MNCKTSLIIISWLASLGIWDLGGEKDHRVVGDDVHFHPGFSEVQQEILHALYPSVPVYLQRRLVVGHPSKCPPAI